MMLDWRGQVSQCASAKILFVKNGEILTPTPDCFLNGIACRTVIGLAKKRQIKVTERKIMPDELVGFEQCFIVGTAAEVTPVGEVGPYSFTVGDMVKSLREDDMKEVQPKPAWLYTRISRRLEHTALQILSRLCLLEFPPLEGRYIACC
jgi:branched-chain amino acid aminotransferase